MRKRERGRDSFCLLPVAVEPIHPLPVALEPTFPISYALFAVSTSFPLVPTLLTDQIMTALPSTTVSLEVRFPSLAQGYSWFRVHVTLCGGTHPSLPPA